MVEVDLSHSSEMRSYPLTKCDDTAAIIRMSVTTTYSNDTANGPAAKKKQKQPVGMFPKSKGEESKKDVRRGGGGVKATSIASSLMLLLR